MILFVSLPHVIRRAHGFSGQHLFFVPVSLIEQARKHPLLQGLFLTSAGYYPEAPGHLVKRTEGHHDAILIACVSGRGWLKVGEAEPFHLQSNEVAIIPARTAHQYGADDLAPWSVMWAHFRGQDLSHFMDLLQATARGARLKLPVAALEQLQLEKLYQVLESSCTVANLLSTSARLRWILTELIHLRVPVRENARSTDEALRQNIDWMRLHLLRRVKLEELARQAGFSVPHYSALFKRKTGYPPMAYFQRLKMQHASQLLVLTDTHVDQIARAVGLEDPLYFSRLFKKIIGLSPRHFRAGRKN